MPHLIIDDIAVEVPAGTTVIAAAEQVGIMIPRFCYLKALGSVGACRMCAVSFLAGPVQGIQMSCMVKALDGMVVSTTSNETVAYRRQIIEWLMINHPHDCPVCDEGGRCLLQDETISGGHTGRRFPGKKRTYLDQNLGPFIQHEMNRCIHCYRCVRFYQDYTGYRDFGTMRIGNRVYYGRFSDGPLESPFAGNLADLCPTGVLTDKPARYQARHWDMQRSTSVCLHCGLGCNTTVNAFQQAIVRQEARENAAVNGSFICDRGRFGCLYANYHERPRDFLLEGRKVSRREALTGAGERLAAIIGQSGPEAVGLLGSGRSSLETLAMLRCFGKRLTLPEPATFVTPRLAGKVARAVSRLDRELTVSLADISAADFILIAGGDPIQEAPMLALALRQAARKGTPILILDPRPVSLPCDFVHLPTHPGQIEERLATLVDLALDQENRTRLGDAFAEFLAALPPRTPLEPEPAEKLATAAACLKTSRKPVLICGTDLVRESTPDFVADLALLLRASQGACGLFFLFAEANACGAVLGAPAPPRDFSALIQGVEEGKIKALICVESDPFDRYPDRRRLAAALSQLELLLLLDHLPSATAARATILLPTSNHFECGGHFINQEGRIQYAQAVQSSAPPLAQSGSGTHPPRDYVVPDAGEGPQPADRLLAELLAGITGEPTGATDCTGLFGKGFPLPPYPAEGLSLLPERLPGLTGSVRSVGSVGSDRSGPGLELLLTDLTFGSEELSAYSTPIRSAAPEPLLTMHPADATAMGLADGDLVKLHLDHGTLELPLRLSGQLARGVVLLPRHHRLDWQQLDDSPCGGHRCRVVKG